MIKLSRETSRKLHDEVPFRLVKLVKNYTGVAYAASQHFAPLDARVSKSTTLKPIWDSDIREV
ncbi:MAG TPA: hypothetical protein VF393_04325 [archaeon]